jgi:TRAP transporter 4TM/12TM fusion protein
MTIRGKLSAGMSVLLGLFVFYTSATGPFDSLVQRSVFLGVVLLLGLLNFPLGAGQAWRRLGVVVDLAMAAVTVAGCAFVAIHTDTIMTSLPEAGLKEILLTAGLILVILELSRRSIGYIFPLMIIVSLLYAFFGDKIPGRFGTRGFDLYFITETLYLGDIGLWGLLLGVAATVIAAFSLFGSLVLQTGGAHTFIDLALRLGGGRIGGGAKIATIASGIFGMVSGSSVANVATTGTFTIPLMKRLKYPPEFAAATEAVASTGSQIAPPIMGAAAFIMAEILGVDYVKIMVAGTMPALFFYGGLFMTIHFIAGERGLGQVEAGDIPGWRTILNWRRLLPILGAACGLAFGIFNGNSIQTACFYGMVGIIVGFVLGQFGTGAGPLTILKQLVQALGEAGQGLVVVGVLLAGAQIMVAMINLTGIGITISSLIVGLGGNSIFLTALIVAAVCMVMGMGIPTTAAYVLVAAILAPAMIKSGIAPLVSHMFVFYYATLSVITPPVCVAVFLAAGIAQTGWPAVARRALALGAVTYVIPFLFILYPGLLDPTTDLFAVAEAFLSGSLFVIGFAALFGNLRVTGHGLIDRVAWLIVAVIAVYPHWFGIVLSIGLIAGYWALRRRQGFHFVRPENLPEPVPPAFDKCC